MTKQIIAADESLNRHGYRNLMSGAKLNNFRKNPVMLVEHDGKRVSIGRWENITLTEDQLLVTPVFDEEDELGATYKRKYEQGFIFALSIQHIPISLSDAPEHLMTGQYRSTVTEWELIEISWVNIPGNPNAVSLSLEDGKTIDDVLPKLDFQSQKNNFKMNSRTLKLMSLPTTATVDELNISIEKMLADNKRLLEENGKAEESRIDMVLTKAIDDGKITLSQKEPYRKLLKKDFATTLNIINDLQGNLPITVNSMLQAAKNQRQQQELKAENNVPVDRSKWKLEDYRKFAPDELSANPKLLSELTEEYEQRFV